MDEHIKFYICSACNRVYPLLDETILSVVNQTYSNYRWTIIDNTDDFVLREYFDTFFQKHPEYSDDVKDRIQIIPLKSGHKVANMCGVYKNLAINLSGASDNDYIVMFDADDILKTNVLMRYAYELNLDKNIEFMAPLRYIQILIGENNEVIDESEVFYNPAPFFKEGTQETDTFMFSFATHPYCFRKKIFYDITGGYAEVANNVDDACINIALIKMRKKLIDEGFCRVIHYTSHQDWHSSSANPDFYDSNDYVLGTYINHLQKNFGIDVCEYWDNHILTKQNVV